MNDQMSATMIPDLSIDFANDSEDHHDHSAHMSHAHSTQSNHGSGSHDMMSMAFHFGFMETILFSFWKIDSMSGLVGSMIGIFLMSVLYEGLKVFREYLLQRSVQMTGMDLSNANGIANSAGGNATNLTGHGSSQALRMPLAGEGDSAQDGLAIRTYFRPNPFSWTHMIQTVLHMVQMFVSYLLMLIFMTFNVWLCSAVVLGAGCGYFAFGWRKRTIIDYNEHCH